MKRVDLIKHVLPAVLLVSLASLALAPADFAAAKRHVRGASKGSFLLASAKSKQQCRPRRSSCADTTPPSTPTGLAVTGTSQTAISLAWNAPTDNVGVTGYALYLNGAKVGTAVQTTYIFSPLSCGTSYRLAVAASDAAGNLSPKASTVAASRACPDSTPPSPPTGLAVTATTQTGISVAWSGSSDNVGVTGYDLYLNGTKVGTTAQTSYTFSPPSCGTSYTLGVDAYDATGNRSVVVSVITATAVCLDTIAPTMPANLAVTAATQVSISLAWSPSADYVGVAGYRIFKNGTVVATTAGTGQTISGLSCGTSYGFGVAAYDAAGNVSAQATVTTTTSACSGTLDVYSGGDIGAAITSAAPGTTTIVVHSGTYPKLAVSRQFSSMTSVEAAPGASVTIQGIRLNGAAFLSFSGFNINSGSNSVENVEVYGAAHDIAITNNRITGGRFGVYVVPAPGVPWPHDVTVRDNEISAAYIDDMQIDGVKNMIIQHNLIHDPQVNGQHNDGIQVIAGDGLTITENTIRFVSYNGSGGPNQGIILGRADPFNAALYVNNVVVSSNLIDHWEGTPIILAGVSNVSVVNNTGYDSGQGGTWSAFDMTAKNDPSHFDNTGVQVWNNIFSRMTIGNGSSSPSYCGYNLVWPSGGNTCGQYLETVDPQFVDHTNYALGSTSPAINSGSNRVGTPPVDMIGTPYGIPDRGARAK
jgi:chitodextrinase